MFDPSKIVSCLTGLIGFKQNNNKNYDRLDADLTQSTSGILIDQSAHSLITTENISAVARDYLNSDISAYDNSITYNKYDLVLDTDLYYSLQDSNTNHLTTDTTFWKKTTLLSAYLRRVMNGAAINLFNCIYTQKKLNNAAKTLLSDLTLYEGMGNLKNLVVKNSRFVGYKITPRSADTVITITRIGFQANAPQTDLNFYLYHDSQNAPIAIIPLTFANAISFTWNDLTTALKLYFENDSNSNSIAPNGNYYLGYYEDDISGQVIWRQTNFSGSCPSCNTLNNTLLRRWTQYVNLQPVYVDNSYTDVDRNLFDVNGVVNLNNQNWGMNLRVNVQCDVSDLICRNSLVFTDAYKMQIVRDILKDMAYSVRDNQLKQKVQQMAMLALNGDKNDYAKGVEQQLKESIEAVSIDMSSLNSVCTTCNDGRGLTIKSVYR